MSTIAEEEPDLKDILLDEQIRRSRMSTFDIILIVVTTVIMYGRIMCDLYLAGLYAAGISSDQIRDEFEAARDSFGTFIILLFPGIFNMVNSLYLRTPEEYAEEFRKLVADNSLYEIPIHIPDDFTYVECTRFQRICCCGIKCCEALGDKIALQVMNLLQIRGAYDMLVSIFKLQRVTGAWRNAVMFSVATHAVPQVFLQCFLFYFNTSTEEDELIGYSLALWYAQLGSIILNGIGIVLAPNHSPAFDYAYAIPGMNVHEGDISISEKPVHDGDQKSSMSKGDSLMMDDVDGKDTKHDTKHSFRKKSSKGKVESSLPDIKE
mmetsp:Transcript_25782/g.41429  ORF Transcript_25782/g.41429 Transcript_25782/m.41429 type:complete len:321 (-) Transcript_25782:420-1382(-)